MKYLMIASVVALGGVAGGLLGHFGKCSGGACPLTANPWRGTFIGLLLGGLLATSLLGRPGISRSEAGETEVDDSAVVHISGQDEFEKLVLEAGKPALVDFYADWCPPCRALAPQIAELANQNSGIVVAKVDVDNNKNRILASKYNVRAIPHIVLIQGGKTVSSRTGYADTKTLNDWIDEHTGE